MNRFLTAFLLALVFGIAIPASVSAEEADYSGDDTRWEVEFTSGKEMKSTFDEAVFNDMVSEMQPGDSVLFTVHLQNNYEEATRWYMTNTVLKSLEKVTKNRKSAAASGAYEYVLTYINSSGTKKELFNSETVGGEGDVDADLEGLNEATYNLEDFFYLDKLATGKDATITLKVALDGETQGNAYQDTRAEVQMNFAVELDTENTTNRTRRVYRVAKTGDYSNLRLYFILAAVSGLILLILGCYSLRLRKAAGKPVRRSGDSSGRKEE